MPGIIEHLKDFPDMEGNIVELGDKVIGKVSDYDRLFKGYVVGAGGNYVIVSPGRRGSNCWTSKIYLNRDFLKFDWN